MRPRIFYANEKGNIEFTKEQLEKLINDIYDEGKSDGISYNHIQYVPYQLPYQAPLFDYTKVICANEQDDLGAYFLNDDSIGRAVLEFESFKDEGVN